VGEYKHAHRRVIAVFHRVFHRGLLYYTLEGQPPPHFGCFYIRVMEGQYITLYRAVLVLIKQSFGQLLMAL
jgi:hypothetical protein